MKSRVLLICFFLAGAVQADIYKYTNKQGKTSYSDTPVTGAEKVFVPPVMTYEAPVQTIEKDKAVQPKDEAEAPSENVPYSTLDIISPIDRGTVRNNQGTVNVTYDLQPALQKGDVVELLIDGVKQLNFDVQGLAPGEHTLQIQVVDSNGGFKITSQKITFYLHRNIKR
ncbi:MAG: DUF4124 domain-containing protein [Cycloclasticus sp.]